MHKEEQYNKSLLLCFVNLMEILVATRQVYRVLVDLAGQVFAVFDVTNSSILVII